MCNPFLCIVTKGGDVLFTEENSHEEVTARAGLVDGTRSSVRVEYTEEDGYRIDERVTPEWYERIAVKAEQSVIATYNMVHHAWTVYKKVEQPAREEYKKVEEQALAVYEKKLTEVPGYITVEQQARTEYYETKQQPLAEYNTVERQALTEYKKKLTEVPGYTESKLLVE